MNLAKSAEQVVVMRLPPAGANRRMFYSAEAALSGRSTTVRCARRGIWMCSLRVVHAEVRPACYPAWGDG